VHYVDEIGHKGSEDILNSIGLLPALRYMSHDQRPKLIAKVIKTISWDKVWVEEWVIG